jgi:hypothetical protein
MMVVVASRIGCEVLSGVLRNSDGVMERLGCCLWVRRKVSEGVQPKGRGISHLHFAVRILQLLLSLLTVLPGSQEKALPIWL